MKTVVHADVDGFQVVTGFREAYGLIDPVATAQKIAPLLAALPEQKQWSDLVRTASMADPMGREHTVIRRIEEALRLAHPDLSQVLDQARQRITEENAVYCQPPRGEDLISDSRAAELQAAFALRDQQQLLMTGEYVTDLRGTDFWLPPDTKSGTPWRHLVLDTLGEEIPAGGVLPDALTEGQRAQISQEAKTARLAALSPAERTAEVDRARAKALSQAAQKRSELEIIGDPCAAEKSEAWYQERLKELSASSASGETVPNLLPRRGSGLRLLWVNDAFLSGQSFGYSVHSRKLRDALIACGVSMVSDARDADLAVSVTWPTNFQPVGGVRNLLFTQAELSAHNATTEVWSRIKESSGASMLVTSCTHSREVLSKYYPGPVEICPLGIDPTAFPFFQRKEPSKLFSEPFRFLWVNNAKDRQKGVSILLSAWEQWRMSGRMPGACSLYIKASGTPGGAISKLQQYARVTMDSRELTVTELAALYNSSHAFIQTSFGEAWGLTVTEAMATGLPCIWTHWSAPVDYADETIGYPVTNFGMTFFARQAGDTMPAAVGAMAREEAIIQRMEEIFWGYGPALARGRAASERMHTRYTWAQAAEKFIAICQRALDGRAGGAGK